MTVLFELVDLVYQGDSKVVMEGCACIQLVWIKARILGLNYYSVEISAPANAKFQSCFLQL